MKQVSSKQSKKNRILAKIKSKLDPYCAICGNTGVDLAHLLPKGMYPEYYAEEWNLKILCREHHNLYDNEIEFRQQCTEFYNIVKSHDELAANRYFKI